MDHGSSTESVSRRDFGTCRWDWQSGLFGHTPLRAHHWWQTTVYPLAEWQTVILFLMLSSLQNLSWRRVCLELTSIKELIHSGTFQQISTDQFHVICCTCVMGAGSVWLLVGLCTRKALLVCLVMMRVIKHLEQSEEVPLLCMVFFCHSFFLNFFKVLIWTSSLTVSHSFTSAVCFVL